MRDRINQHSPVIICGMHRSGTSLIAQVLSSCGLFLGSESLMYQSDAEDNPKGYWENRAAVEFGEELLEKIGSTWSNPEKLISNSWILSINYEEEKQRAMRVLEPLSSSGQIWGWKDPRATLLLPFWKRLFPKLRVVICLRNPLEVAFSLSKRTSSELHVDFNDALILWRDYYAILSKALPEMDYVVTHFESIFYDPSREINRICKFSNLSPSEEAIDNAQQKIKKDLYRGMVIEGLLNRISNLPAGLLTLYQEYLSKTGDVYHDMRNDQNYQKEIVEVAFQSLFINSSAIFDQYFHQVKSFQDDFQKKELCLKNNNKKIMNFRDQLLKKEEEILFYANSKSWRFTRPLRKIMKIIKGKANVEKNH